MDTFLKHANEYKNFFLAKGYPDTIISEAIDLAKSKDRLTLLSNNNEITTPKKDNFVFFSQRTTLITNFSPNKSNKIGSF